MADTRALGIGPLMLFAPLGTTTFEHVSAVCIGTGRFLRTVLVPALLELGGEVILAQTRGTNFGKYLEGRSDRTYEVDTVLQDGRVITSTFPVAAAGSLGIPQGRETFLQLPAQLPNLCYIGLGLTEAGITHNGQSIVDLAEFLHACFIAAPNRETPLSIINTDNLPFNGDAVRSHVCSCDFAQAVPQAAAFESWLRQRVHFHNTMVDRITSHRRDAPDVPRAEPLPAKALVIEDLHGVLPVRFSSVPGVVVRARPGQLALDIAMKLRVANGLHTAMVYAMALGRLFRTDACIGQPDILPYLEQLFERDIVHACRELSLPRLQLTPVFNEWMARLQHPHFGLECFFVCQNATQKMGIRLLPSVKAAFASGEGPSEFMVYAFAVILRFLTPIGDQPRLGEQPPVFMGQLDPNQCGELTSKAEDEDEPESWEYIPGLSVRPRDGTYEFRDNDGIVPLLLRPLGRPGGCSVAAAVSLTSEVLSRLDGFHAHSVPKHGAFAEEVGKMLHQSLNGVSAMSLLASLRPQQPLNLQAHHLAEAVQQEVEAAEAIDVHTHLFSAGHGKPLMKFGIDAMLTYHYLVSEYLASSAETADEFYQFSETEQAEHVWQGLFVKASPLSEQCQGVLTTLSALGLHEEVAKRDLSAIRRWYGGQDAEMFNEKMMRLARLRYVVTSHDPFECAELASCLKPPPEPPRYRSALSLDKLLEGQWDAVCSAITESGLPCTLRGVAMMLQRCVQALRPVFLTLATPHNIRYSPHSLGIEGHSDMELDALLETSSLPSPQQVLDSVILPLCQQEGLPLSLRMGMRRGVNPTLRLAGDGVGPAQLESLSGMCQANPKVKFLVTVLGRGDHHEAAVLASKFRNLHLWGCWWYCNNPSVVSEVTALRLEMLGTGFTFQASSARVHDQLIYKWIHSRNLLARLLTPKYAELMAYGWQVSRGDIRRDVQRLLGGAYEEFLAKQL